MADSNVLQIRDEVLKACAAAADIAAVEAVRVDALGKKGRITELMKTMGALTPDERKAFGQQINTVKDEITAAIEAKKTQLESVALDARLAREVLDVTLPVRPEARGSLHPISQTVDEMTAIFGAMGFEVAEGPDVEDDFHNFTALNFPPGHPAREMHDTFFLPTAEDGNRYLLRTHTSPVQIRTMMSKQLPIRVIIPGRTYRCDYDMTHTPMFHQMELLVIDRGINMAHLRGCLEEFLRVYFGVDDLTTRFRPSFFPFTEPSAEVDIGCSRQGGELKIGNYGDWLEILGCGMVHPNVMKACGLDPEEYQGFAAGLGVERIAMLKYGIPDLRTFFESDLRWLRHYGFAALDVPTLTGGIGAMKFTLSWLKDHLETTASLDEIAAKLTAIGLEVESLADPGAALKGFIVGHVLEAKQHPNADRLRLCTVSTGTETLQVVCGAPNARAGIKVVLARPGVTIPATGDVLKKGKIRDVESQGMMCSARELKMGEDHDGIIELPADAPVGADVAGVMNIDPVIEINLTPNRVDALGVYGVARDLAAAGVGTLKPYDVAPVAGTFDSPRKVTTGLPADKAALCPQFVGRTIRGVKNAESPAWLKDRLTTIGLRPVSALVDITQYLTIDLGRPLHAFDDAKLTGAVGPRLAKDGESLIALNGKTYALDTSIVAIADESAALGIGGVMGGEASAVSETTTTVFLESALFDPLNIAATGRKLQINSDARYCFERGVDPESAISGAEAATRMILKLCGGEASHLVQVGAAPQWKRTITFDPARVHTLGGIDLPPGGSKTILQRLGFAIDEHASGWNVIPPSWRGDVEGWQDLVEEVLRIHGYDAIPAVPLPRPSMPKVTLTPAQRQAGITRRTLASRGLAETTTWSFLPRAQAELFRGELPLVLLANPISSDLDALRPSLIPNLAAAAGRNANRGMADVALFELGPRFEANKPGAQVQVACALRAGHTNARHWAGTRRPVDAFDAKADALAALDAAGASSAGLQTVNGSDAGVPGWFHPGRAGVLKLGNQVLATFGELHPRVLAALDLKGPVVACEVFLERLPPAKKKHAGVARPLLKPSPFQPVERDFAFVVDAKVAAETVLRAVRNVDKALITDVGLFDVYVGAGIGAGEKSLALSVTLQPRDATLTDTEIDAVAAKVVAAVEKACGGRLRA